MKESDITPTSDSIIIPFAIIFGVEIRCKNLKFLSIVEVSFDLMCFGAIFQLSSDFARSLARQSQCAPAPAPAPANAKSCVEIELR